MRKTQSFIVEAFGDGTGDGGGEARLGVAPQQHGEQLQRRLVELVGQVLHQPVADDDLKAMWSKGPQPHDDYNLLHTDHRASIDELKTHIQRTIDSKVGWIWIRSNSSHGGITSSDLDTFSGLLDMLTYPLVLVSTDGDRSIPSELLSETVQNICESPFIVKWYTQNYDDNDTKYEKIHPYPIGLDLHSKNENVEDILKSLNNHRGWSQKHNKIFCDTANGWDRFGGQRKRVGEILSHNKSIADTLESRVSQDEIWKLYSRYHFVVSPPGGGWDCHRTWEILLLGSVPILKTSPIDSMFYDLPVIILNDWDELQFSNKDTIFAWLKQVEPKRFNVTEKIRKKFYPFAHRAVFVGCARNIQDDIKHSLSDVERLAKEFNDYRIILYENDSNDDTKKIIQDRVCENSKIELISESDVPGSRTVRLARGRNILLDEVKKNFHDFDFMVVMDLDYKKSYTTSLVPLVDYSDVDWQVLTGVSRENHPYYDWWALRQTAFSANYDCWKDFEKMRLFGDCMEWDKKWKFSMKRLQQARSAFNGIAVYKIKDIPAGARYIGNTDNGDEVCEHVSFNSSFDRLFIHPYLLTSTWDP